MARHPIQPLKKDKNGTVRFKANEIVRHLLDHGGIDLNQIARMEFSQEDREQFAQLIGYSHSGAGGLSYFSDEVWHAAEVIYSTGTTEMQARLDHAEGQLNRLREALREPAAELFGVHPDDLQRD